MLRVWSTYEKSEMYFISHLLRFSDRIYEKLIRKFFHPITIANRLSHTWEKPFHPIRKQLSEWISQFANAFTLIHVVFGASSIFIHSLEACRVSTSLLKFSRKLAINHRQSLNRFIALDEPIKRYIQEEQSKKPRTKTRWNARLACLANFSTEGRGKKSFKEGKYAALKPFSTTTSFTKQGNVWKLEANDVKEQGKGNKSNAGEAR